MVKYLVPQRKIQKVLALRNFNIKTEQIIQTLNTLKIPLITSKHINSLQNCHSYRKMLILLKSIMVKHNGGLHKRLSLMFTSNKKNFFLKHLFYIAKNENIPQNIPSDIKFK